MRRATACQHQFSSQILFFDLVISPFAGKSKIVEVPTGRAPPSLPVGAATCAILLPVPLRLLDSPCAAIVLCLVQNMQLAVPEDASIREQGRQEVRPRAREGMCECSGRAPAFILSP